MHIAPNSWESSYKSTFKDIIKAYPCVVIGMMAAHSHYDELRAIVSGKQTIPIIFSAGLSTGHGNSASFKTISINREANGKPWTMQNYTTYYFKGYKADSCTVQKYYNFKPVFCSPDSSSLRTCIYGMMNRKGSDYVFDSKSSKLLSEPYYANPAVPGKTNATGWVLNY